MLPLLQPLLLRLGLRTRPRRVHLRDPPLPLKLALHPQEHLQEHQNKDKETIAMHQRVPRTRRILQDNELLLPLPRKHKRMQRRRLDTLDLPLRSVR